MSAWLRFQIAWWRWIWQRPSASQRVALGRENAEIIMSRWYGSEPKSRELERIASEEDTDRF